MIKYISILSLFTIFNINAIFANPEKNPNPVKKKRKVVIIQKIIRRNTKPVGVADKVEKDKNLTIKEEQKVNKEKVKNEDLDSKKAPILDEKDQNTESKINNQELNLDKKFVYFDVSAGFGFYGYDASLYQDKAITSGISISTTTTKILDLTSSHFGLNGSIALGTQLYKNYIRGEIETSFFQIVAQSSTYSSALNQNIKSFSNMIGLATNFYTDLSINTKFFISLGLGVGGYYYSGLESKIIPGFSGIVALNFKLNDNLSIYIKYKAIIFDSQSFSINESQITQTSQVGSDTYYANTPVSVMHFALVGLRYYFW